MAVKLNENREYQRILLSEQSEQILESRGYETVFSSNVSAIATSGDDLVIRFHNGSVYAYDKQAKNYERLMAAASKGKWVWRFLRRKNVPYRKIGSLPLPEDVIVQDEEIMRPRQYDISTVVPPDFMETGALPSINISPVQANTVIRNVTLPPTPNVPTIAESFALSSLLQTTELARLLLGTIV